MGGLWGLDVQQVRNLGQQLDQKSNEVQTIMTTLSSQLQSVEWRGPDGDRFKQEWDGQHRPALQRVIEALQQAGTKAKQNADAQEQTSNA